MIKENSEVSLWCVNIPEDPYSEEMLYPVPSNEIGGQIVSRLKNEALKAFPKVGDVIADSITLEQWKETQAEHEKFLSENPSWWNTTTFLDGES